MLFLFVHLHHLNVVIPFCRETLINQRKKNYLITIFNIIQLKFIIFLFFFFSIQPKTTSSLPTKVKVPLKQIEIICIFHTFYYILLSFHQSRCHQEPVTLPPWKFENFALHRKCTTKCTCADSHCMSVCMYVCQYTFIECHTECFTFLFKIFLVHSVHSTTNVVLIYSPSRPPTHVIHFLSFFILSDASSFQ